MIEIANLCCDLGGAPVLTTVDLTLQPGKVTGLIGPNGAGKSTLLHCMAGLIETTKGTVMIDGLNPFTAPSDARARTVALLQQSPTVVSRLKVRELVGFGRWPHHQGRVTAHDIAKTEEAIAAFDLVDLADRSLDALSGGQRQRAFVAMTYAQDTPWIFLDEPLNALDPRHAHSLMSRIQGLAQKDGRSIVVVLHDISAAARWTDHIVAMKDGSVLAHGPSREILTPELLLETFDTPFDTFEHNGRLVVTQS